MKTKTNSIPCANCKLRAKYDHNPKSFLGRFWYWHIGYCPGFEQYYQSLDVASQKVIQDKYDFYKMKNNNRFLIFCAGFTLLMCAAHLLCLLFLDKALHFYGVRTLIEIYADSGPFVPYVVTIAIATLLAIAGFYGLSKANVIRPLPMVNFVVFTTSIVLFLRGIWGFTILYTEFSWLELSSTVIALVVSHGYIRSLRQ